MGPAPWLALACLAGLVLAYAVLANFTGEPRAALWGEPGTVSEIGCRTHDATAADGGTPESCSGTFTPDGGGSPFAATVEGDIGSPPVRARLDDASGTAYLSPTVWAGVLPVGLSLLLAGLPVTVTVLYARHARAQGAGRRPRGPERPGPARD
ncbi:hypothetical protein [Streptomyces omiyaensis]|uniref:Integral membrane protein n=1 Tax=Streptomyces omiyaensis TaxID=68247 RepID=A0ABW7BUJ2_9ACTN|nr:hypothetical protein [Streptomyces omiyaensis]GGY62363.1 hypothetical protein GCM10010363_49840 [Streptomyces omiyaensis]